MIGYLQSLIRKAKDEIESLKKKIKKAEEELENCIQLRPILIKIGDDASNGYHSLQNAANSLNKGIIIDGVGQGNKITERAETINNLSSDAKMAVENVNLRIKELEENVLEWNNKINKLDSSITGWNNEISRLNQIRKKIGLETKQ